MNVHLQSLAITTDDGSNNKTMAGKLQDLASAVDVPWDVPQSRVICGAHLINTVVQSILKDTLKATGPETGMEELDEDALIDLAATSTNPVIKVSNHT
jgi:hypothetical protein